MEATLTDGMRDVLERSAREIHARRDEWVPLVVEGEHDELERETKFWDRRAAFLRACLESKDERDALSFSPWSSSSFDFLDEQELAICREFGIWWPGIVGELSHRPTFEFPPELCRRSLDRKWPFDLSAVPTTRGAAALFLAEVHDTFFRIGGNGIFEGALRYLESTPDGTRGAVYARLAAKYASYSSGDLGPGHLFPAFDGKPVAACDVEKALEKMMGRVFGKADEPESSGVGDGDSEFPRIEKADRDILLHMLVHHPETCLQADVISATGVERKLCQKRMQYLRDKGLTNRPLRERKGDALTDRGLELARLLQERESEKTTREP